MLTGRLPFEAETPLELVDMHRRLDAPAVAIVRPDAPEQLAALADAALARDPCSRPADGAALATELGVVSKSGSADAPTLSLRLRPRGVKRSAVALAALVLLAVAGTTGAILLTRKGSGNPGATIPRPSRETHAATTASASTTAPTRTSTPSTMTTTTTSSVTSTPPPGTTVLPTTVLPPTTSLPLPTTVLTTTTSSNP
jgi:serine/threonine protein kinase